jgi:hypothetical protein
MALQPLNALGSTGTLDTLETLGAAAMGVESGSSANTGQQIANSVASSPTYSSVIIIIIGLLLLAAGIFSINKTREILVQGTKAAAAAA